jgi:P27 family predicted phage terminase small subunit
MANPPIPTKLRILRGNPGHQKINKREPQPKGDLKEAPANFTAEQKAIWDYAIQHAPAGLLKMLDGSVLEVWCVAHELHQKSQAEVQKVGMIVKAPNTGTPIQNPFLAVMNKQALIMLRAVDHLGFSPASRSRIVMGEGSGKDDVWSAIQSMT